VLGAERKRQFLPVSSGKYRGWALDYSNLGRSPNLNKYAPIVIMGTSQSKVIPIQHLSGPGPKNQEKKEAVRPIVEKAWSSPEEEADPPNLPKVDLKHLKGVMGF
jgi:hypothetical protein